jgi:hypothetical protein
MTLAGSDLTYEEFMEKVERNHQMLGSEWRYGQTYLNTLSSMRPWLADKIRGTIHDPFHGDRVKDTTHTYVKQLWNEN